MAPATRAVHFRVAHPGREALRIAFVFKAAGKALVKAAPARAPVELRGPRVAHQAAPRAGVGSFGVLLVERAGSRPFGPLFAQDVELLRCEQLAPFGLGLHDLADGFGLRGYSRRQSQRRCGKTPMQEFASFHGRLVAWEGQNLTPGMWRGA